MDAGAEQPKLEELLRRMRMGRLFAGLLGRECRVAQWPGPTDSQTRSGVFLGRASLVSRVDSRAWRGISNKAIRWADGGLRWDFGFDQWDHEGNLQRNYPPA
jgi:hypothetical protein